MLEPWLARHTAVLAGIGTELSWSMVQTRTLCWGFEADSGWRGWARPRCWSPDISVGPGWWRGAGGRTSGAPPGCHHLQAPGHWTPTPSLTLFVPDTRHVPSMCPVCAWCLGATCPATALWPGWWPMVTTGDGSLPGEWNRWVVKRTIYDQQPPTAARGTALSLQLEYKTMLKTK